MGSRRMLGDSNMLAYSVQCIHNLISDIIYALKFNAGYTE